MVKKVNILVSISMKNSYSEVFELLKYTDKDDVKQIPTELIETIKNNRNKEYIPNITDASKISIKASNLYLWLYLKYINKDEEEKRQIMQQLQQNQLDLNYIFKSKKKKQEKNMELQVVEIRKNTFQKIIIRIKEFFRIKR